MCGICGIIRFDGSGIRETEIRGMMAAIRHRGPDDHGIYVNDKLGFGFNRLSILDLSPKGHQPFWSDDQRYVMVFNGEIYNYLELKEELTSLGYNFHSTTDTEVLLKAYIAWGEAAFHKFNGMWAVGIFDTQENSVFFSRDRFGIKPFYYTIEGGSFYFASEIPALLAVRQTKTEIEPKVMFDYLVFNRTEQSELTFFKGIYKLQHGHCLKIDLSKLEILPRRWYDLEAEVSKKAGFQNAAEYKQLLYDAVAVHLRSDVKTGVSLSGGLDSSAITAIILEKAGREQLESFSAVFQEDFKEDEKKFIDLFEDSELHKNFVYPDGESLLRELNSFIACHAEPMPSTSPYAQYKVMQRASEKVTVMLNGQGADEQLGGYHYFYGFYFKELFKKFRWGKLAREMFLYLKIQRSLFAVKTFVFFLLPSKWRTSYKTAQFGHYTADFLSSAQSEGLIADNLYGSKNLKAAFLNHFEYKLEHLLKWEDRNSMRFSVEAREPFLDYRLVEQTLASDPKWIIRNGETKFILRESLKGVIPERIRKRQDKIGYVTPEDEWFRTDKWQRLICEILESPSFAARGIFDVKKTEELYMQHLDKRINISREIWKWVNLELWFRKYID
ncbi:MAG: asnB2 [Crocinitomicaceae bacterium]|jgi:asparagine synthase (glutamine-hydrolysing)|nr:asnB2 [Crocinitomicaceae bacterium]